MKCKLIAFVLALTIASWAQTTSPAQPTAPDKTAPAADAKCSCCAKMASEGTSSSSEHKHACMHQKAAAKDGKETASCCSGEKDASCCQGKDAKACAKAEKGSAGCCGEKCDHEKGCCSEKDGKKIAHNCCGESQCSHDHQDHSTPGN
jgi:hypothetical protein